MAGQIGSACTWSQVSNPHWQLGLCPIASAANIESYTWGKQQQETQQLALLMLPEVFRNATVHCTKARHVGSVRAEGAQHFVSTAKKGLLSNLLPDDYLIWRLHTDKQIAQSLDPLDSKLQHVLLLIIPVNGAEQQ